MADRLRTLLDCPLGPGAARAVLAFATAILLGVAVLFVLAASEPDRPAPREGRSPAASSPPPTVPSEIEDEPVDGSPPAAWQDPQDVPGSAAARRAARALRSHRALQHIPYRDGEVTVALAGARGRRAVLRVSASTIRQARRGWHRFLRRYRDSGRAYVPVFAVSGGHRG